jgi:hypothetical protein
MAIAALSSVLLQPLPKLIPKADAQGAFAAGAAPRPVPPIAAAQAAPAAMVAAREWRAVRLREVMAVLCSWL